MEHILKCKQKKCVKGYLLINALPKVSYLMGLSTVKHRSEALNVAMVEKEIPIE